MKNNIRRTRFAIWLARVNEESVARTRNCCGWPSCSHTGYRIQDTGNKIQGNMIQDTGHMTLDTGHRTQDTGQRTQDTGHMTQDT